MSTPTAIAASQLIRDALVLINVIRETQTPSAEQQATGIRVLNEMMAEWEADGKPLRYIPVGTVTDILTVPDGAIRGIKYNLAVALAPAFGATVSDETATIAASGLAVISKITAKEPSMALDVPVPSDWVQPRSMSTG